MNKADFIKKLKEKGGYATTSEAEKVYNCFLDCMEGAIVEERELTFTGFGTFKVVARKERKGRNPRTGKEIHIAAIEALKFTPAKKMKEAL